MKVRHLFVSVLIISLVLSCVPVSFGQQAEVTQADVSSGTEPGRISMEFKNADINNVLRILAYKSNVNIVAGPEVEGSVTVRLVDVPWEKALDVVLKTYGFAYERDGNIIRVTTVENLSLEPLKTEVFSISYAKAPDISESIREMVSERGSVKSDERSNTIIVTDIPTNIYKIEQVIEKLDKPTPQVYIDAKIIETTLDDDEKLGIDWTVQVTATGAKIPTTAPFNRDFSFSPWKDMKEFMPKGDPTAQAGTSTGTFEPEEVSKTPLFPFAIPNNFAFGTLNFSSFQAILRMLDTRADTKIISNPRMVTLDNQEATIHVGQTLYVPEFTESENTGSPVFSDMKKTALETGIKLKVTPHVNSNGEIVVDVVPEVSTRATKEALLTTAGGDDVFAFPVEIRTAKASVMIKDGETIAMGGLLKEQTVKTRNKVPFLGDIPLLGHMFRYSEDTIDTRDLLIFITVKLIEPSDGTKELYADIEKRMEKMDNAPEALGHQYEPDTPAVGETKRKQTLFNRILMH